MRRRVPTNRRMGGLEVAETASRDKKCHFFAAGAVKIAQPKLDAV
jgi:hypothetical protein